MAQKKSAAEQRRTAICKAENYYDQTDGSDTGEKELLWNIHQKYLHEMTRYYENEMDEYGNYHYGYFDAYFTDPKRTALLIFSDEHLAGFAMINPYSYLSGYPDHVMAEFTIFPMYRRKQIGTEAVRLILEKYRGGWEIKYNEKNTGAEAFWTKVTEAFHPEKHRYSECETVLTFSV